MVMVLHWVWSDGFQILILLKGKLVSKNDFFHVMCVILL